jgi:hypothetical protein
MCLTDQTPSFGKLSFSNPSASWFTTFKQPRLKEEMSEALFEMDRKYYMIRVSCEFRCQDRNLKNIKDADRLLQLVFSYAELEKDQTNLER